MMDLSPGSSVSSSESISMFGRMPSPFFPSELLDPQAQHAPALGGEERELVAALQVIVVEERRQVDGRVIDGVLRTGLLGRASVGHERFHVDTCERRRHQPEHRERREPAAHRGLAGKHRTPAFLACLPI